MDRLRVLTNPNRCMQRLGFLKRVIWKAAQASTNNLAAIGTDLIRTVSQNVEVQSSQQLQQYISKIYRGERGRSLGKRVPGPEGSDSTVCVELQDYYLALLSDLSCRGKLNTDDWRRYPHWAVELGLLRDGIFAPLVRGQAFLALISDQEKRALLGLTEDFTNPLRLTLLQRLFLSYCYVAGDGDVLAPLYASLLQFDSDFADRDAGDLLPEIFRSLAKRLRSQVRSGDDLVKVQQLLDSATKIEAWKNRPYKGRGVRDEAGTIRLEPIVDLALLAKPDPFSYRYRLADNTAAFFQPLIDHGPTEFLENRFFETCNRAFRLNLLPSDNRQQLLRSTRRAYAALKSPLGYAPVTELALLSSLYLVEEEQRYFELATFMSELRSLQKEYSNAIVFNIDRQGTLSVIKFNRDPLEIGGKAS